jgi:ElaA protein
MDLKSLEFNQLTPPELYLILRARSAVFVVEQSHVHLDMDGKDEHALHIVAIDKALAATMPVIAYARVNEGDEEDPDVVIDKIFTCPTRRDGKTAELLMQYTQAVIRSRWPERQARLNAPLDLRAFYERFGFKKAEGPYLEHGIRYIGMVWRAPRPALRPFRLGWAERAQPRSTDVIDVI